MATFIILLFLLAVTSTLTTPLLEEHQKSVELLNDNFIDKINKKRSTWTAGRNFPENTTLETLRHLAGDSRLHSDPNYVPVVVTHDILQKAAIPKSFDARTAWSHCESIGEVRDQGACGSCWAFAAAETMTDRLCIQSNGTEKFTFSAEDLMTCCSSCRSNLTSCNGGYSLDAYDYWNDEGIVSGGDANSNKGCQPYSYLAFKQGLLPSCEKSCEEGYGKHYQDDKKFGKPKSAHLVEQSVEQIQYEILNNGPVHTRFEVFKDFYSYKSGVYQRVTDGNKTGNHAVKIIGWGEENEVPYWLIVNSWGSKWGDHGLFKFLRGQNHCRVEDKVIAASAQLSN